jgi:uncharacterized protein YgiM (DUF1202 family)
MKRSLLMFVAMTMFATPVLAAERIVQADAANLRAAPGLDKPILMQLARGARLEALGERGEWVQVRGEQQTGWVHASLLSSAAFADFKKQFDYRNRAAKQATGETFFHEVTDQGDGVLRVVASDVWLQQPEAGRLDNVRFILWIWSDAQPPSEAGKPLQVVVVDRAGRQRMALEGEAGAKP